MGFTVVDEFSYFAKFQNYGSSYDTVYTLNKVDTLENVIWSSPVGLSNTDIMEVYEIIPSENDGIYLMSWIMLYCDVGSECFWFIQKFDSNGDLDWTKTWLDENCFETKISGLKLNKNNDLLLSFKKLQNQRSIQLELVVL